MCIWICHVLQGDSQSTHTHTHTHIVTHKHKPKQHHNPGAPEVSLCVSDNKSVLGSVFISNPRALLWKCHEIDPQARPLVWYGITLQRTSTVEFDVQCSLLLLLFPEKKAGKWKCEYFENWNAFAHTCIQLLYAKKNTYKHRHTSAHGHRHTHTHGAWIQMHGMQGSPVGSWIMEEDCVNPICA